MRPQDPTYPEDLYTIGDHLRARRLDLDLLQREAAERLGVTADTVRNWECGRTEPNIRQWSAVIIFLGGYPFPTETTAEEVLAHRRREGLSIKEFAVLMGADPTTVRRWERGQEPRNRRSRDHLQALFDGISAPRSSPSSSN